MGHAHPCRHAQVHELTSKCRAAGANDEHSTAITWERISVADCRKQVGVQTRCCHAKPPDGGCCTTVVQNIQPEALPLQQCTLELIHGVAAWLLDSARRPNHWNPLINIRAANT